MIQTILLDSIIIISLFCAVFFCWKLNGRLHVLKDLHLDITPALQTLTNLSNKLSEGMSQMREQMKKNKEIFGKEIPKAQNLKEDLELLLEYCESTSKNLEKLIKESRKSKQELDDTFQLVARAFPQNIKNNLEISSISIDFDALKNKNVQDILNPNDTNIIPHKIEVGPKMGEFFIDEALTKSMGDLH